MAIYALGDLTPTIDPTAFVHPDAVVIGNVHIGPESSIWPCAVLRGDHGAIHIGEQTSIQDGTVVHCTSTLDTVIGDRCVIGHGVHLEGCTIHDDSLIGSHAVVLHNATVGPISLVGAQALVGKNKSVPPHARALGVPAAITPNVVSIDDVQHSARIYVQNSNWYRAELKRLD